MGLITRSVLMLMVLCIPFHMALTAAADADVETQRLEQFGRLTAWLKEMNVPYPLNNSGVSICVKGSSNGSKKTQAVSEKGILIARGPESVVAYTDEMRLLTLLPQQSEVTISIETIELIDILRQRIRDARSFAESVVMGFCWERGVEFGDFRSPQSLDLHCRELLVAYWCHELNEVTLRDQMLDRFYASSNQNEKTDLREYFSDRWASCLLDRAIVSIANIQNTHAQVADRIDWVDRTFWKPGSMRPEVTDLVAHLRKAGDIPGMNYEPGGALDDIALVRLLCQQRCRDCQIDHSGHFDYICLDSGHLCPAALLLLSGSKSTSALLNAIGDRTPTRRVLDSSLHLRGPKVDTVGAMAVNLLECLHGTPRLHYEFEPESDEEIEEAKAAFRDLLERGGSRLQPHKATKSD